MFFSKFFAKKKVQALISGAEMAVNEHCQKSIKQNELNAIQYKVDQLSKQLRYSKLPQKSIDCLKAAIEKLCLDHALGRLNYTEVARTFLTIEKKINELEVVVSNY
jgi:hypothetical protein